MASAPRPEKRHAACDECRSRKLKCTGGLPACERCITEATGCVYSLQKPMGRPRKRKKEFDEDEADADYDGLPISFEPVVRLAAPPQAHYTARHKPSTLLGTDSSGLDFGTLSFGRGAQMAMPVAAPVPMLMPMSVMTTSDLGEHGRMMAPPPPIHTPAGPTVPFGRRFDRHTSVNVPTSAGSLSSARPSPESSSSSPSIWSPPDYRRHDRPFASAATSASTSAADGPTISAGFHPGPFAGSGSDPSVQMVDMPARSPSSSVFPTSTSSMADSTTADPSGGLGPSMFFPPMTPSSLNPECACLSNSYLATSNLHAISISFPKSLIPIKKAIIAANDILECNACPRQTGTAMQNMFTLATLLTSVVDQVRRVLATIEDEVSQATSVGASKLLHLHADPANPDYDAFVVGGSVAAVSIETGPDDWGRLARQFIRNQIVGSPGRAQTLVYICERLRLRQETWHATKKKTKNLLGQFSKCVADENGEYMCLKMVRMIRGMVDVLEC